MQLNWSSGIVNSRYDQLTAILKSEERKPKEQRRQDLASIKQRLGVIKKWMR